MRLKDFFNNEYLQYANSINYQNLANYIDGFKPTQRKLFHLFYNFKEYNKTIKVASIASAISEKLAYLSGEASSSQVAINMAKNYTGSNNIPIFDRKGHFGSRFKNESASPRYIFIKPNPIINKIFKREDLPLLKEQIFEGEKIEPAFFLPIIPMILVNGAEGLGNGFAQKILPRRVDNLIEYIKTYLKTNTSKKDLLKPYINGFKGEIEVNNSKVYIKGNIRLKEAKRGYNYYILDELPLNYDLAKIIKKLEELIDKGLITDYTDNSENDDFTFIIKTKLDNETLSKELNLTQTITENFTCVNENYKIVVFKNVEELMQKYIQIRLEYYTKRKKYILNELKKELEFYKDRAEFIALVIKGEIVINKKSKQEIIDASTKKGIKFIDKHITIPVYSFSREKINELKEKINSLKLQINELENKTNKDLWLEDLSLA